VPPAHLNRPRVSSFWQAAWGNVHPLGYIHTSNNGENWIGIFAAAAIGFTLRWSAFGFTGSAGAIGCHASWDWAETYFYGAGRQRGNVASGHYLTTTPAGPAFWSGGSDGPEGSVLVLGAILLLLIALVVLYGRREPTAVCPPQPRSWPPG